MTVVRAVHGRRRLVKAPEREWRGAGAWLLTCGTLGRASLFAVDHALAAAVLTAAHDLAPVHALQLDAACVMPDHVHLLLQATRKDTESPSPFLHAWQQAVMRERRTGGANGLWQEAWGLRALPLAADHCLALDYTVQNPVRAGLAAAWTDYEWTFSRFHDTSPWQPNATPANP